MVEAHTQHPEAGSVEFASLCQQLRVVWAAFHLTYREKCNTQVGIDWDFFFLRSRNIFLIVVKYTWHNIYHFSRS